MPDWSKDVISTSIANVAYEAEGQRLIVTWMKGSRRSVYTGVPEELALQLSTAPSAGSMIRTDIIPYYAHHYE